MARGSKARSKVLGTTVHGKVHRDRKVRGKADLVNKDRGMADLVNKDRGMADRGMVEALGLASDRAVVLHKVRRCKVQFSPAADMAIAKSRGRDASLTHQLRGFGFEVFVRCEAVD
jgi:hypothetical protein